MLPKTCELVQGTSSVAQSIRCAKVSSNHCNAKVSIAFVKLGLFGVLKLSMLTLALQFLNFYLRNAYFSIAYAIANFSILQQAKVLRLLTLMLVINSAYELQS